MTATQPELGLNTLTEKDYNQFSEAEQAILRLLSDNQWHPAQEIIDASGQREGLRRLRSLRKKGYEIQSTAGPGREWRYRLGRITNPANLTAA